MIQILYLVIKYLKSYSLSYFFNLYIQNFGTLHKKFIFPCSKYIKKSTKIVHYSILSIIINFPYKVLTNCMNSNYFSYLITYIQHIYLMKILLLSLLIVNLASTLNPGIHRQAHKQTNECCTSKGGKLCGTVVKDCCKSGCEPGVLNSQWCKQNEQFDPICQTCMSICKKEGGIPCQISANNKRVSCCSVDNCIKADNSTDSSSGIAQKIIGFATSKLIGVALAQHQMADEIIQKFKGPNNYCKQGTQINLGNCMADSFLDLVQAKILS